MPILDLPSFKAALPMRSRVMGLDIGTHRIGIAVSDETHFMSMPLQTLERQKLKQDKAILDQIIAEKKIGGCVVGWPLNMNGTEGPKCQSVRDFMGTLLKEYQLLNCAGEEMPVFFWDERLSTVAMQRSLISDLDTSRKKRAKVIDQMAAQFILQGALDAMSYGVRL